MFARFVPVAIAAAACLSAGCAAASRELQNIEPISITSAMIGGAVTDSTSRQPIVGVQLMLLTATGDSVVRDQQATTFTFGPRGEYRFDDVKPGSYVLRAAAQGYRATTRNVQQIKAGERVSVAFVLQRGE
jgi:carboxypeptidase family protein